MKKQPNELDELILTPVGTYIKDQLQTYVEPARGEGFSRAKYEAALWSALKPMTQKELAEQLDLKYDVVRQWHSQSDFIQKVDEALQEFGVWFANKLSELDPTQGPVRFGDVDQWSELAARTIGLALERRGLNLINADLAKELLARFPSWRYPRTKAVRDMILFEHDQRDAKTVWHDLIKELEPRDREREHKLITGVLRNPNATKEQREQALRAFEAITHRAETS